MKQVVKTIVILVLVHLAFSSANGAKVFGPETYSRSNGRPNIFTETFSALPGQGTLQVQNSGVTSASILVNNVEIFRPKDFKKKVHDLEAPVDLYAENTLRVELRGKPGTFLSVEIVQDIPAPSINAFSAQPETISPGAISWLEWDTENATRVDIDQGVGEVAPDGSITVSPLTTTQYTLTATGPGGTAEASVTVIVTNIHPMVTIDAFPPEISQGESCELIWDASNAQYVYIDNNIGQVPLSGSVTVSPVNTNSYTITVTGEGGSASAEIQVRVLGNPEPLPEGSFGWNYQDLIPPDATIEQYNPKRFAVITGSVQDVASAPLADVTVSIHNHPEYGTVATGADGRFSIPVEGGSIMTIVFQKEAYLCAHRKVEVPWNDIAISDTPKMIPQDPASTVVTFDGDPNTIITHKTSEVTDEFGSRSCTLVFHGDNRAYAFDKDGNEMFELESITARATEFTTQDTMPARLPPNSAYTYCIELSADGIKYVIFDKPVITWVDNFLGFEVGEAVPVGFYDRGFALWVPSDNGVVVKLLDMDGDNVVDALDADGDDLPNDLNQNGTYTDEVIGLDDPSRYVAGQTFWRVAVSHFTPWDYNWPYGAPPGASPPNPKGLPDGDQQCSPENSCEAPISSFVEERSRVFHEDIPITGTDMTLHYASSRVDGYKSVIIVPASGDTVPESLNSIIVEAHVAGRHFKQNLAPSPNQMVEFLWDGLDFRGNLVGCAVNIHIRIGFVYDAVYYNAGNSVRAFAQPGGQLSGIPSRQEIVLWRNHQISIHKHQSIIAEGWTLSPHHYLDPVNPEVLNKGNWGAISDQYGNIIETIAGGGTVYGEGPALEVSIMIPWSIDVDAEGNLYIAEYGGFRVLKLDTDGHITTVAGNGTRGYSGDEGDAINAQLDYFYDIALDNEGNLYIADTYNHRIRMVGINGIITTVAGNGIAGLSGDGGNAIDAQLSWPGSVVVDPLGNIYIGDAGNNRIRKVDNNGIITTMADFWSSDFPGDPVEWISDLALDRNGDLYVSDSDLCVVYRLETKTGMLTKLAGTYDQPGYGGDGGPATEAYLREPEGLAVDHLGNVLIADRKNHCVRKIGSTGIITTIAGDGSFGYSGDGGPATLAQLAFPNDVLVDHEGNLLIVDEWNDIIRRVKQPVLIKEEEMLFQEENGLCHVFSKTGRHKKTLDFNTGVVLRTFGYNQDDKLISITDRFGNATLIQREADNTPTAIVSPDGLITALTIDDSNHLTAVTYQDGSGYGFDYTADGLMTAETEPNGNRFDHHFDSNGRLTDALDEEGGHWNFQRAVFSDGNIAAETTTGEGNQSTYWDHTYSTGRFTSTIVSPDGSETQYERSADGLTVHKSLPCGMSLDFTYDADPVYRFKFVKEMTETTPSGLSKSTLKEKAYEDTNSDDLPDLISETMQVNGKTTLLQQNVLISTKTVTSPQGRVVTMTYDPQNLLASSVSIPGLFDTSYGYDSRGRLTSVSAGTRQTSFAYNAQGFLASVIDPKNHTTTYTYDPVGRATGINRPDGSSLGFTYDPNGNMTVLTNPADISHLFGYNKVNLNNTYQTPLSGTYTYVYDKDRRLIQTNFPSGYQINHLYDKNRLVQIQTPEGNIDLTYVCGLNVGSIIKESESISYTYDGKLMASETLNGALNQTLSYGYNNDFDLESFTYAGDTVTYTYDNDGLLIGVGAFTISRNAGNGLPESVAGGALDLTRAFNGYSEIEQESCRVGAQSLSSWDLTRDKSGRITHKTEVLGGIPSNYDYTYDPMGRLLTVTKDGSLIEAYQYGLTGARISETNTLRGISGKTFAYSEGDHLLIAGDVTYQYDVDGYLAIRTHGTEVTTYSYSSRGELLNVTLPDGTLIEYLHDPLGRRICKKVNGVTTEKYLWQGLTRLLAIYDGSDNLLMRFYYADAPMPYAMTRNGTTYYLDYDPVGSLRVVADPYGNVVKRIDYDSFGNVFGDTNLPFKVPFGFAGGLHDRDTGLVRFGYRDYDPDIGRWTAKDPIFFAGGDTDLYGYCLNDPVNWVDEDGLQGSPWNLINASRAFHGQKFPPVAPLTPNRRKALNDTLKDLGDYGSNFFPGLKTTVPMSEEMLRRIMDDLLGKPSDADACPVPK